MSQADEGHKFNPQHWEPNQLRKTITKILEILQLYCGRKFPQRNCQDFKRHGKRLTYCYYNNAELHHAHEEKKMVKHTHWSMFHHGGGIPKSSAHPKSRTTRLIIPASASVACTLVNSVPGSVFSNTVMVYGSAVNSGALSFTSSRVSTTAA